MSASMWVRERVFTALAAIDEDIPVAYRQLLTEGGAPLPAKYLVYTVISAVPDEHADDEEKERFYRVQVTWFSTEGLEDMPDIDAAMKSIGGAYLSETDLDRADTGHFGLAIDYSVPNTGEPEGS